MPNAGPSTMHHLFFFLRHLVSFSPSSPLFFPIVVSSRPAPCRPPRHPIVPSSHLPRHPVVSSSPSRRVSLAPPTGDVSTSSCPHAGPPPSTQRRPHEGERWDCKVHAARFFPSSHCLLSPCPIPFPLSARPHIPLSHSVLSSHTIVRISPLCLLPSCHVASACLCP
jgi:hypothetical protein